MSEAAAGVGVDDVGIAGSAGDGIVEFRGGGGLGATASGSGDIGRDGCSGCSGVGGSEWEDDEASGSSSSISVMSSRAGIPSVEIEIVRLPFMGSGLALGGFLRSVVTVPVRRQQEAGE